MKYTLLVILIIIVLIIYFYFSGFFIWGKRAEIEVNKNEKSVVDKYKKQFKTYDVKAIHDFESIKSKKGGGIFNFYISTEDSIFSFRSITNDSMNAIARVVNYDIQQKLSHKEYYDSINISFYTIITDKNREGFSSIFSKSYIFPITDPVRRNVR